MGCVFAKICINFVIKKMRVKIVCFSDESRHRYKRIPSRLFSILHRGYTDWKNLRKRFWGFWRFSGKNCRQDTRTAATMYWALHTVLAYFGKTKNKNRRFLPKNSCYDHFVVLPTKMYPDTRTKIAQKCTKKCFTHTLHRGPKYTGFFCRFPQLTHFWKKSWLLRLFDILFCSLFGHSSVGRTTDC